MIRPVALAAALATALAGTANAADRVVFTDGRHLDGVVESQTAEELVLRTGNERRRYPMSSVAFVSLDRPPPKAATPAPVPAPTPAEANPAPAATGDAAPAAKTEKPPVVDETVLARLRGESVAERLAAMRAIPEGWPATSATLEAALAHESPMVRLAAASLLGDSRIERAASYVPPLLSDTDAAVRRIGIRMVRLLTLEDLETRVSERVRVDPDVGARKEALAALEAIGTAACLRDVVFALWTDTEKSLRPRYHRVLRKLTGEDARDDDIAWREAAERAIARAATIPAPASATPAPATAPTASPATGADVKPAAPATR